MDLYERIVDRELLVRRIYLTANHVIDEAQAGGKETYEQLNLFTDYEAQREKRAEEEKAFEKESVEDI